MCRGFCASLSHRTKLEVCIPWSSSYPQNAGEESWVITRCEEKRKRKHISDTDFIYIYIIKYWMVLPPQASEMTWNTIWGGEISLCSQLMNACKRFQVVFTLTLMICWNWLYFLYTKYKATFHVLYCSASSSWLVSVKNSDPLLAQFYSGCCFTDVGTYTIAPIPHLWQREVNLS